MFSVWYILPAYFFAYVLVSFFFNWKILYVAENKWSKAVAASFMAEFMFAGATLIAAFYSTSDMQIGEQIGYIFASSAMMGLGTAVATLIVGKIQKNKKSQDKTKSLDSRIIALEKQIKKLNNEK